MALLHGMIPRLAEPLVTLRGCIGPFPAFASGQQGLRSQIGAIVDSCQTPSAVFSMRQQSSCVRGEPFECRSGKCVILTPGGNFARQGCDGPHGAWTPLRMHASVPR